MEITDRHIVGNTNDVVIKKNDNYLSLKGQILRLNIPKLKNLTALIDFHYRICGMFFDNIESYHKYFDEIGSLTAHYLELQKQTNNYEEINKKFLLGSAELLIKYLNLSGKSIINQLIDKVADAENESDIQLISNWLFNFNDYYYDNTYEWMVE